ncbi:MAG: site-2 protease family protein [Acidobacteriota bacterium]|jgi:Zn-dependent protease/CBS domain-containing protein
MFGKTFDLFSVFGFKIRLDVSWFVVAVLITWSLASAAFPQMAPDLSATTYWLMGVLGALGLFASVVAHELSHASVARRYGIDMRGITLFIFGGVAEMSDEPPSPKAEFWVAIAGPIASLVLGLLFLVAGGLPMPAAAGTVVGYLGVINIVLAVFNMIPAFPLDGGRILRSVLWQWKDSLRQATRITSAIGSGFGFLLIGFGILRLVAWGDFVGGMWMALIGLFVRNAAQMSYQQLLLRRVLEGEPVSRFMEVEPVVAPPWISVEELVEDYVYRHHFKMFPVVSNGRLEGCVTTRQIKELPRDEWANTPVRQLARECSEDNSIAPDADAMKALSAMSRNRASRLLVVEGDELRGVLALKDLLDFFAMKIELEG